MSGAPADPAGAPGPGAKDPGAQAPGAQGPGAQGPPGPYPPPLKRSLTLSGHRTSVSLEEPFWQAFRRLAEREGVSVNALASRIDAARGPQTTLASAIRLHVLSALTGRP